MRKNRRQEWRQRARQGHSPLAVAATIRLARLSPAARALDRMMRAATLQDWQLLHGIDELRKCIFYFDHEERGVHSCAVMEEIQWPIVWLLARFNRKHLHVTRKLPDLVGISESLIQLEQNEVAAPLEACTS